MSRDGWIDDRAESGRGEDGREATRGLSTRAPERPAREVRRHVSGRRGQTYRLRDSEWRTLETVGTFRVVAEADLARDSPDEKVLRYDLQHLAEARLVERKTGIVNHQPTRLVVLTRDGKALLDRHRESRGVTTGQQYYAGFVKPRELAHDVQLYRAYRAETARIEADGGHVTRVALDYELKRDYQTFLTRRDRSREATVEDDRRAFAEARNLPIIDGHLELPDLRLEYAMADGRVETRDVEVVTEHYSRAQLAGKTRAGFALYRPVRVATFGRSGEATRGGTPVDPNTLEWLR
jgi:hypothetical protein